jgi:hypothetical protein
VRRAAVEALGRLGSIDDRALLLARFYDPAPMVRVHAARAAATALIGGSAAEALVQLLSDREWIVRAAARESLRTIGGTATPAVTRALWHGDAFAANNAAEVLFQTGVTVRLVHELLHEPSNGDHRRLVERLLDVSGPQILRAVNDQLDVRDRSALQRVLREAPPEMVAVRNR